MSSNDHDRQRDIRRVAKILRAGGYTYDQSKHLIAEARKAVGREDALKAAVIANQKQDPPPVRTGCP